MGKIAPQEARVLLNSKKKKKMMKLTCSHVNIQSFINMLFLFQMSLVSFKEICVVTVGVTMPVGTHQ